jgi:hypothetical protein
MQAISLSMIVYFLWVMSNTWTSGPLRFSQSLAAVILQTAMISFVGHKLFKSNLSCVLVMGGQKWYSTLSLILLGNHSDFYISFTRAIDTFL